MTVTAAAGSMRGRNTSESRALAVGFLPVRWRARSSVDRAAVGQASRHGVAMSPALSLSKDSAARRPMASARNEPMANRRRVSHGCSPEKTLDRKPAAVPIASYAVLTFLAVEKKRSDGNRLSWSPWQRKSGRGANSP
ncbi:MAG: hypothetical protein A3K19_32805 [Lentisphaerae bacterium RIFOXYB12_FULL_65_16]|nr:MAG: hypothetical protein A3K18_20305 [Lentisphaerae bacterium RIFOXYA12_64_32]OGV84524.1 MAG: hypothetical protein A3K19_32805 [Lentisphaerae bacterium RIFOXYB12_FULL_65_16]